MAKTTKTDSFRRISEEFAKDVLKNPIFQAFYINHPNDVIVGIRDNYINLYHCCNSIAKISPSRRNIVAKVHDYYLGIDNSSHYSPIREDENLDELYETITKRSLDRGKEEKQAQEKLFIDNNKNQKSNWFCIDVEYTKSFASKEGAEDWRFDIIAVSKSLPHRVALIELKYGAGAIGGKSGVQKHIQDYYQFHKNDSYTILLPELISIIDGLKLLGGPIPTELKGRLSPADFASTPEYYFITLNNNPEGNGNKTPQMTMSGYLFTDHKWGCKRVSSTAKTNGFYAQVNGDTSFKPVIKFSKAVLPDIGIDDIIDSPFYENAEY